MSGRVGRWGEWMEGKVGGNLHLLKTLAFSPDFLPICKLVGTTRVFHKLSTLRGQTFHPPEGD